MKMRLFAMFAITAATVLAGSATAGPPAPNMSGCTVNTGSCGSSGDCTVNTGTCENDGHCTINTGYCSEGERTLIGI
jgi:hypothetical protein